jgi:signal transduction histidine kinase
MPSNHQKSIGKQLTWMNLLVSGAALLLAALAFAAYQVYVFKANLVRTLAVQAQIVGANSNSALLFNDPHSAENNLDALKATPHIVSAAIYRADGQPFAGYWRGQRGTLVPLEEITRGRTGDYWYENGELLLLRKISFQGKPAAVVVIRSDLVQIREQLEQCSIIVLLVLLGCLSAVLLVSRFASRTITGPFLQLAGWVQTVTHKNDYSLRASTDSPCKEFTILVDSFNEMLAQIRRRDDELQKSREQLEERVEERTSELEATNKELEAFTYSVSHDLRAPLRHINGFSQLLIDEYGPHLPEGAGRYLDRIQAGARQMGQLVDELLNLSRIGRRDINIQVTGLDSLVEQVVGDLKMELNGRKVEWKISSLPFVECDPTLMRQVFVNLLSNAVKYSRPRDPAVIEVGSMPGDGQSTIFVRDNGVGFNMKYANKLFGVFQRLHRAEDFEGTGIGLATVQRIIQKHGGSIWVEAELDKGATFYFTLGSHSN